MSLFNGLLLAMDSSKGVLGLNLNMCIAFSMFSCSYTDCGVPCLIVLAASFVVHLCTVAAKRQSRSLPSRQNTFVMAFA
jgi:hypothetical protein